MQSGFCMEFWGKVIGMRQKTKVYIIFCVLVIAVWGCVAYAAKVYEVSYTNNIKTGSVDIRIDQYEVTADGEKLVHPGEVMPNMDVSYIPRVTNLRAEGYVRVKAEIVMDEETPVPMSFDYVFGMNDDWIRIGDYFYCKNILKPGESSDIFQGFNVPYQWTKETASGFTINLKADVVQADYFKPDFDSITPWGSIQIEKAKVEDNITYGKVKTIENEHGWTYTSASGFETNTRDLFSNFNYLMAGESCKDTLEMRNESDNNIKIYFKTENTKSDLLEKMTLRIYCDGKTVYEGELCDKRMKDYFYLTMIASNKMKDFDFEVILPDDSQNYYSALNDNVVWKFRVSEIEDNVKTGDETKILPFIVVGAISVLVAVAVLFTRRKDGNNEKN